MTCRIDCEKLHKGFYIEESGECIRYEALRRVCILVDVDVDTKNIEYEGGCYEAKDDSSKGEIADYDTIFANKTYPINSETEGVMIEVRSKKDPYTVFAQAHYNIGRDLDIVYVMSTFFLGVASFLALVTIFMIVWVFKT